MGRQPFIRVVHATVGIRACARAGQPAKPGRGKGLWPTRGQRSPAVGFSLRQDSSKRAGRLRVSGSFVLEHRSGSSGARRPARPPRGSMRGWEFYPISARCGYRESNDADVR
jgi:hypothetical protein